MFCYFFYAVCSVLCWLDEERHLACINQCSVNLQMFTKGFTATGCQFSLAVTRWDSTNVVTLR